MPSEIERKFLIKPTAWKPATRGIEYRQGYLSSVKDRVVRVRIAGEKAFFSKPLAVTPGRSTFFTVTMMG
jgi:adenylate cyclase